MTTNQNPDPASEAARDEAAGEDEVEFSREVKAMLVEVGGRAAILATRVGLIGKDDAAALDVVWRDALDENGNGDRLVGRLIVAYRQGTATMRRRMAAIDLFQAFIDRADVDAIADLETYLRTKGATAT